MRDNVFKYIVLLALLLIPSLSHAQIGDRRNDFSVGVNVGYNMSSVGFNPDIPQKQLGGLQGGITVRYTCEKYFKSICALVAELNISQMGWNEDIKDVNDEPVINEYTGLAEEYQRQITYFQLPLLARLGWGRERKGFQGFFQLGPQFGYYLSDKVTTNFDYYQRNYGDRASAASQYAWQDTLAIKNKFDYGIAVGAGLEYSHPKLGHFILEARYYYGLGDMFGNSKRDDFGRSNNQAITVKLTYLFDLVRTKNDKIK